MEDQQQSNKRHKLYLDSNLQIIFGITLMAILGVSSITPAFPDIARGLGVSPKEVGLLITFFTMPGIILTPVLGILADRIGRKRILVPSLLLFSLAGTSCAFIRNFQLLLMVRMFQGFGAAALGAINVTIIGDLYKGKERTEAMGYNSSVLSIGTASYPLIGGALATFGWYFPFYLPLLALPMAFIVLFFLKNPEPKNNQRLRSYFRETWKIVKKRQVIGLFLAGILTFIILFGAYLSYYPFLIGHQFGKPAYVIGLIMSSMSLTTALTAFNLGKIAERIKETTLLKTAGLLYTISLLLIPSIPRVELLLIPALFFGLAQGVNIPSIMTLIADHAPIQQRAAIMSLNGMVLRTGQTLGPLVMGLMFSFGGLDYVFYFGAVVALLMFTIVMFTQGGEK